MSIANKNYLGVALAGLAIIMFWILTMPVWDRTSLLNEAIAEREDLIASRESVIKKIEKLNMQYQERSSDVNKISSVVPSTKSAAELVSTMEAISQQTGIQLIEITMSDPGTSGVKEGLQTAFFELGLVGNYPSLAVFLDLLEKNLRLIDVSEISASQVSLAGVSNALNFRIKAKVYYLKVNTNQ